MKPVFKTWRPYIISVLFMLFLSVIYFSPDIFEGRVLFQGDTRQGIAIGEEGRAFKEATGETTRWTNSLFGGMPNFQISPSYGNNDIIRVVERIYSLGLPDPVSYIFIMMLGFFILLSVLRVKWPLALLGSVAYAFSSYFFIIIAAGHIWKFITLAYIPPTIAGIILAYRGKYLSGAALAAFFGMLQICSNHIQMSYYFGFFILALVVSYAVEAWRNSSWKNFGKATGALVVAAVLAIAANMPNIYNTYEYAKETMRGKSELVSPGEKDGSFDSGGLSLDYITQWSYGIGESWTLLVPNVKGGATGYIAQDNDAVADTDPSLRPYVGQMNHYWGDQPFTAGPVYAGAVVMFLFLIGCFVVKGAIKWASLAAIFITLLLSWGHNFMPLTEWFVNNVPLYNKFRTVSSILVVAEFCIPLLAVLGLKEVIASPSLLVEKKYRLYVPLALTGGVALLFALFPTWFFDFVSKEEAAFVTANPDYSFIFNELARVREGILSADAWRTFWFVAAAFAVVAMFVHGKMKSMAAVALLGAMVLVDMYGVNKRYLNSGNFVEEQRVENPFPPTAADLAILQDKDPNFRVLNLTVSTYDDPVTSYYHKSVGGYSAAKLRRYDDLIKYQLLKNNPHVINMLNTKYLIVPDDNGAPKAVLNPDAAGNAWFVSDIEWVDDAASEMSALDDFDERRTAVIDTHFKEFVKGAVPPSQGDTIYLESYRPNNLVYKSSSARGGFAVFSEIYFPWGWHVSVDGEEVPHVRVNYVLRGLQIPAGEHTVVFRFDPDSLHVTTAVAYVSIAAIFILSLLAIYRWWSGRKEGAGSETGGRAAD